MHPKTIRLLHSLIVTFRGYKYVAQTIIPGILSSDVNSITVKSFTMKIYTIKLYLCTIVA